jgi:transposase InsO family protein
MKTESEFPGVYLDFTRQRGIPSALSHDNAKPEMSHRVRQIHRDLVIADQWTEPYSPWQNPAELNCVKYLKSELEHLVHCGFWHKTTEQVSRGGGHQTFPIS